jgi:hypothetical protein
MSEAKEDRPTQARPFRVGEKVQCHSDKRTGTVVGLASYVDVQYDGFPHSLWQEANDLFLCPSESAKPETGPRFKVGDPVMDCNDMAWWIEAIDIFYDSGSLTDNYCCILRNFRGRGFQDEENLCSPDAYFAAMKAKHAQANPEAKPSP